MAGFLGTIAGQVRLDIRQAVAAYATIRAQNARTVYALRGTGDSFVQAGQTMATAGAGLVYVFGKAVSAAAEFERKMDFFGAVTDTNAETMQRLSKYTLKLAQDTIYSANEITDGLIELGKAGVNAEQVMNGIGDAMANLGAAGDIPLAQSGQIITSTIQQFDLAAQDAVRVTDLLAGAANASIADISDIGVSLKYVGGVANAAGLTFEDTVTAISLLAKAGIRGSTAGTSLRQMLVSLGGATGPAKEALTEIGVITKDNNNLFYTAEGRVKPLSQVYQVLQDKLEGYTQKQRLAYLRTIFNNRALSAAAILTREGAAGFRDMNKEMDKTTAADVASERLDNLSGDIEILKGNIETLLTEQGGPFQEMLRGWTQDITELIQAFGELDPQMQKTIVSIIGITGVALLAMGVINIIIGTIFRFMASMLKLGAAIAFVFKWLRAVIFLIGIIAGGAISATFLAIAAAVLAVAVAFVVAYKKIKPFRDFVNRMGAEFKSKVVDPIWAGIKAIGDAFKLLVTDPKKAWENIKKGAQIALDAIQDFATKLPGYLRTGLDITLSAIGNWVSSVVSWFQSLPGRALDALGNFMDLLGDIFTMKNVGKAIGLGIRLIVARFVMLPLLLLRLAAQGLGQLYKLFGMIGPKIGFIIGFVIGFLLRLWWNMWTKIAELSYKGLVAVLRFFQQLPGRVGAFALQMAARFAAGAARLVSWGIENGPKIANNIMQFINGLPGRLFNLAVRMGVKLWDAVPGIIAAAINFGTQLFNGIWSMISGLPGLVWSLLGQVIQAFKDMAGQAFDAAKSVGSGLWNGFKKGLGINSPSYIEKAMFQVNDTMGEELKKLRRNTLAVQDWSKKTADAQFNTGTTKRMLDVMNSTEAAQRRAATNSVNAPRPTARTAPQAASGSSGTPASRLIGGKLTLDERGNAFITGIAEDVTSSQDQLDSEAERRNRED